MHFYTLAISSKLLNDIQTKKHKNIKNKESKIRGPPEKLFGYNGQK